MYLIVLILHLHTNSPWVHVASDSIHLDSSRLVASNMFEFLLYTRMHNKISMHHMVSLHQLDELTHGSCPWLLGSPCLNEIRGIHQRQE